MEHFPVTVPLPSVAIGTRLDADINVNNNLCRLAFFGTLLEAIDLKEPDALSKLRVYKPKSREGRVDRVHDAQTLLAKDLFKKVPTPSHSARASHTDTSRIIARRPISRFSPECQSKMIRATRALLREASARVAK